MECGGCTACCTVLKIDDIDKPMDTPCQYCTGMGCSIHSAKPETCKLFKCGYYSGKNVPDGLRPDKCGIIFIKKNDRIFSGILVKGVPVTDVAKGQIESFRHQGYSVILVSTDGRRPHVMPAEGQDADGVFKEYKEVLSGNV